MKSLLCAFIVLTLFLNSTLAGQGGKAAKRSEKSAGKTAPVEKSPTAFEALKIARQQLGDRIGANLLSIESENGKLRPRYWWLRFYDDQVFLRLRAVQMIGAEMVRNVEPGNPFDGGSSKCIILPDSLKYDSEKCIAFMEKAASENNIPLHSLNMKLYKPYPGESNPLWFFEWFDDKLDSLGSITISATSGKVTEIVDLKIKTNRLRPVAKRSASQEMEDTFLGIGGELEEFFTGKRTVDQEK
ncbi:MAG: hypothetical protein HY360_25575 [Verrucomicrobia bacterium]|nr:hypothetical protein [Verrucomicrobiota bacterium]